ncbi:MAG: biopolymer transporter ExbD [Myxococcaceae bacterium]|nr:biopolymer transporter ExbD [Myxococcaceae bacterium]
MQIETGGGKRRAGPKPSMNVTPLVDVVLVLLIIFMVVTPLLTKQLWLNVPPKVEDTAPPPADALPPIVLRLDVKGVTSVNDEAIPREQLVERVQRMINARPDKVVFFDADDDVPYGQALAVMDVVRGGGVETLAVLADPIAQ